MPLADFLECMLYEQMEPFGGRRLDYLFSMLASTTYNMLRDPVRSKPLSLKDFTPGWLAEPVDEYQTSEQMAAEFAIFVAAHNKQYESKPD